MATATPAAGGDSGACHGLDPESHRLRRRLRRDPVSSLPTIYLRGRAARESTPKHGFLLYRDGDPRRRRACRWSSPRRDLTVDVDAILAAVTDKTRIVYYRQSQQPDRHLSLARRTSSRLADALPSQRASRSRCRLCGICDGRPITMIGFRASCTRAKMSWSRARSRRSMGLRVCGSAGATRRQAIVRCDESRPQPVQRQRSRPCMRGSPPSRTSRMSQAAIAHNYALA